jgi:MFS family permease
MELPPTLLPAREILLKPVNLIHHSLTALLPGLLALSFVLLKHPVVMPEYSALTDIFGYKTRMCLAVLAALITGLVVQSLVSLLASAAWGVVSLSEKKPAMNADYLMVRACLSGFVAGVDDSLTDMRSFSLAMTKCVGMLGFVSLIASCFPGDHFRWYEGAIGIALIVSMASMRSIETDREQAIMLGRAIGRLLGGNSTEQNTERLHAIKSIIPVLQKHAIEMNQYERTTLEMFCEIIDSATRTH